MALYAWTIRVPNREPIERVSSIDELHQTLTVLDLPGAPSPLGITADADGIVPDTGMSMLRMGSIGRWRG
ncbi:hypothetical protein [Rhizobium sp. Leaf386]|uniref:hypothetical protein n=1 Tax=Rhizobium sp. Leaf386 TaxID=1736359 RepID=UPI0012E0F280|nr:hypothetical protein [Rhizobium sp. Leaf386]